MKTKSGGVCGLWALCVALMFWGQLLNAQTRKIDISGVVKDNAGEVAIGASIMEKGTTNGTITDMDGNFTLSVSPDALLQVSYIGFSSQEVEVGGKTFFEITLKEDAEILDEVVVVGYGAMRKKDLTGSITQIRPDKLANENPNSVQDILRGTPGLSIGFTADAKGGGSMQIRGQRSVYTEGSHNDPLIILDGMMFYGELSEINPDDIGQIDVLKDASAASVYGAKSANGVIIITTKKGKLGKPTVNFNSSVGFTTMGANRRVFDADGYLQYRKDWYTTATYDVNPETGAYEAYQKRNSSNALDKYPGHYENPANLGVYGVSLEDWRSYGGNGTDDEIWASRLGLANRVLENYLAGKTFDWYDHSFRTGINQDYNVSVSGASDRMNYYMSIGYLSNEGVAVGNDYRAIRSNLKLEGQVTDWLSISANVNFQDRSDGDLAVDWEKQIKNSPFASYKNADGGLEVHPMGDVAFPGYNYDFDRQYTDLEKGYTVLNSIFTAKIKLPFNITYSFNAAPRFQWFYDRYFVSSEHPDRTYLDSQVNREQSKRFDWSLNNTINWDYTFADKHHVNLTLVQEAEERQFWQDVIQARALLPTDALGFHETKVGDKDKSSFDSNDTRETADGLLARLFYSYDDRYMLTASVRRDGYSAFGTSNPYATFFSLGLAWSFTEEKFFKWDAMSRGKLRFSWGQNGNRSLENPYIALADLGMGTGGMMGYIDATSGSLVQYYYMSMGRMANSNLQWEKTTSWNVGLDFGFLNDRIAGSIEYYHMPTIDMIMNQKLPGFSGFGSVTTNLGEVINTGVELSLNTLNMKRKNFEWSTTLGFSFYKNKISHLYYTYETLYDTEGLVVGSKEMDDTSNGWFIGQPISAIWDYRVTGIWQKDEAEEAARYGQRPGDPKVANNYTADDIDNGDGTVTPVYNNNDKEFLGQTAPPVHWSLRNDFTIFKNFSFSFNIYSYMGHKSLNGNYLNQDNGGSEVTNGLNMYAKEYWTVDNPTNEYARLDAKGPEGLNAPKKLYDRSFIRLENISLGYTLPQELTSRWKIERVKIYGTIRNVAVWAKDWEYWDPETEGLAPRTYTIGLNLTF